ncbi:hypothetical protein C0J52_00414 [Blattella germanica]|nr:hypothetical protein C0J52_00414 [Blattella germanica]
MGTRSELSWLLVLIATLFSQVNGDCSLQISQGALTGSTMTSLHGREFCSYRGIPYAQPPVGDLRFRAPEPATAWEGVLNATKEGHMCQHGFLGLHFGSEDCLFLNVFTPQVTQPSDELFPVLMFIHGGAFLLGNGNSAEYGPHYLLDQNVVYVSINYRLGALDQLEALRWINKNIASFGGNPELVTIMGESAGSISVHHHILSPLSTGLFHRAISDSGTSLMPVMYERNPLIKAQAQAEAVGCPTENTSDMVDCLRNLDIDVLMSNHLFGYHPAWRPVAEVQSSGNPEPFLPGYPQDIIRSGNFNRVPYMLGANLDEGGLFLICNLELIDICNTTYTKQYNCIWQVVMRTSICTTLHMQESTASSLKERVLHVDELEFSLSSGLLTNKWNDGHPDLETVDAYVTLLTNFIKYGRWEPEKKSVACVYCLCCCSQKCKEINPEPALGWEGELNATKDGNSCVQGLLSLYYGSEDCLYLNVYTPQTGGESLPVLVFIHGGGYTSGSGNSFYYGPHYFLDKDVVMVTINYRLGVLGFLSTGDDASPGNYGLKDQLEALRWINKNIASFGGNPELVTIMGESAGGMSVHNHILSPLSKGLFHRAISNSGSTLMPIMFQPDPLPIAQKRAQEVGCPIDNNEDMVSCLRNLELGQLMQGNANGAATDRFMQHNVHKTVQLHLANGHEDLYLYNMAYRGKYSLIAAARYDDATVDLGVLHADEMEYSLSSGLRTDKWNAGHPDLEKMETRMEVVVQLLLAVSLFSQVQGECSLQTPQGALTGSTMTSLHGRDFCSYRGIPYAQPPNPEPALQWEGELNATKEGNNCVQGLLSVYYGSEDCLFLNVYTPQTGGELLPVLVFFHGGGYTFGSGHSLSYGPHYFLDEDIVLVTINYRLGVIGFLSTGDDASPGNYGLRDQLEALRWINKNIESYGGNPELVTIMGESAGAMSVHNHILSPLSKGLFHRAISNSGSTLMPLMFERNPLSRAQKKAQEVGCPIDNNADLVSCLRNMDLDQLMLGNYDPKWRPTVEVQSSGNPEPFLPGQPEDIIRSGNFNKVPYILGTNSEEGSMFLICMCEIINGLTMIIINQLLLPQTDSCSTMYTRQCNFILQVAIKISICTTWHIVANTVLFLQQRVLHADDLEYTLSSGYRTDKWNAGHPDLEVVDAVINLYTDFMRYGDPTLQSQPQGVTWPKAGASGEEVYYVFGHRHQLKE